MKATVPCSCLTQRQAAIICFIGTRLLQRPPNTFEMWTLESSSCFTRGEEGPFGDPRRQLGSEGRSGGQRPSSTLRAAAALKRGPFGNTRRVIGLPKCLNFFNRNNTDKPNFCLFIAVFHWGFRIFIKRICQSLVLVDTRQKFSCH